MNDEAKSLLDGSQQANAVQAEELADERRTNAAQAEELQLAVAVLEDTQEAVERLDEDLENAHAKIAELTAAAKADATGSEHK